MENESSTPPPSSSSEPPAVPESALTPPPPPSPPEIPTMVEPPPVPEVTAAPPGPAAIPEAGSTVLNDLNGLATEKNLAMFCHLSALVGGIAFSAIGLPVGNILGPLVIWLMKKDTMPLVNEHGKEALNFQLTVSAVILACMALFFLILPIFLIPLVGLAALVLTIIGTIKASNGVLYRYPLTIRLIK
jgi:uncharacterized Tic20 family protein